MVYTFVGTCIYAVYTAVSRRRVFRSFDLLTNRNISIPDYKLGLINSASNIVKISSFGLSWCGYGWLLWQPDSCVDAVRHVRGPGSRSSLHTLGGCNADDEESNDTCCCRYSVFGYAYIIYGDSTLA